MIFAFLQIFYFDIIIGVVSPPNCFLRLIRAPSPGLQGPRGPNNLCTGGGPHIAGKGEEEDNLLELLHVGVAYHLA